MPQELHDALTLLGVLETFHRTMARANSFEEAQACLEEVKAETDKAWKLKAFEAHPDRGGDPEDMKRLNAARDRIRNISIQRPPPPRPVPMVVVRVYPGFMSGGIYASTTGTTSAGSGVVW